MKKFSEQMLRRTFGLGTDEVTEKITPKAFCKI
jgi:hypothetical protein